MYYGQMWPQPQKPPPVYDPQTTGNNIRPLAPRPPQWNYAGDLHHHQQTMPYYSNPTSNYHDYQYNSIQSSLKVEELTPHSDGYTNQLVAAASYALDGAATSAEPSYPYNGEGFSTVEVGCAVDGVYYYGGEDPRTIAAKEGIRQYGGHPIGYASNHPGKPPKSRKIKKKNLKKAPKVVQSAYCEVCKVDCNSQDVLNSHNEGKKHKKKLKQLQDSIAREAAKARATEPTGTGESTADDNEKLDSNNKRAAEPAVLETEVDLETKRSRILEAGAYTDEVRVCTLCNVVVNSQKVYEYHLDGLKHAAMVEKLQKTEFSW